MVDVGETGESTSSKFFLDVRSDQPSIFGSLASHLAVAAFSAIYSRKRIGLIFLTVASLLRMAGFKLWCIFPRHFFSIKVHAKLVARKREGCYMFERRSPK